MNTYGKMSFVDVGQDTWEEVNIVDIQTATKELPQTREPFTLFPNPASEILNLNLPIFAASISYVITDMTGQRTLSGQIYAESAVIDITSLNNGIYFLFMVSLSSMATLFHN